jgi:DNA-binding CsgD family transcriptional regulator
MTLVGRDAECAVVDRLLQQVRDGASGALVVRGEAGIGKSAILDYAAAAAAGFLIVAVTGIESEMEVAFAALQQVCAPLTKHLGQLPPPQAEALRVALGLSSSAPPDRFLAGLGVLSLAAEAADAQPVLCVIADAQWIDQTSLQALAFAARRLYGESVAMIFATRTGVQVPDLAGLPDLVLAGLPYPDACSVLAAVVPGRLDERVRDRIVAEAAGNPLALLEFSREVTAAGDLAGGFGVSPWMVRPLADRVAERFLARVVTLPAATRRLLLLAAAEPLGDPGLLKRAGDQLGMGIADLAPAESEGLLRLDARVTFRHPLVRSAIYRSAPVADRQAAHAALAEATDAEHDIDRRVWHRAHATFGPDEVVADELERSAGRASARGGPAAAAAFLERAAALTADPRRRARLMLASAESKHDAVARHDAVAMVAAIDVGQLDEMEQARLERLSARTVLTVRSGSEAPLLLLQAARRLEPLSAPLARDTYLDAFAAAMIVGPRVLGGSWHELARSALEASRSWGSADPDSLLLSGLALQVTEGYAVAVPTLRRAVREFLAVPVPAGDTSAALWLACRSAMNLWDDQSWHQLAGRMVRSARDGGALTGSPLSALVASTLLAGDFAEAAALIEETNMVTAQAGTVVSMHGPLALAAWQGRDPLTAVPAQALAAAPAAAAATGGTAGAIGSYTMALYCNGIGRYQDALTAASIASEQADVLGFALWALPELVEAAVRSGEHEVAAAALERLRATTGASATDWALGIEARCHALVLADGNDPAAEARYTESIHRLGQTRMAVHLARSRLLYGEWLRREKRRIDARAQLRAAFEMFTRMGANSFASRAERELAATGERVRKRELQPVLELTPQEAQIARLASEGQSNPEIAAQLFLSPRTVEYHLHKIFTKLDVTARGQLARALGTL